MEAVLERLAAARIQLLPLVGIERHFVLERDGYAALVERTAGSGFGRMGTPGLLTEKGLAVLIEREGRAVFVAKGFEETATAESIEALRVFARDLKAALSLESTTPDGLCYGDPL
jgi:hypothetical protein